LLATIEKTNAMCNGKDPENSEDVHCGACRYLTR
jgi:hypothetical protein